jgi:hypothetical protein
MTYLIIGACIVIVAWAIWFLRWEHKQRDKKKWRVKTDRIEKNPHQVKTIMDDPAWRKKIDERDNDHT